MSVRMIFPRIDIARRQHTLDFNFCKRKRCALNNLCDFGFDGVEKITELLTFSVVQLIAHRLRGVCCQEIK